MRILLGMVVSISVFMFGVWLSGELNARTPYGMHDPGVLIHDGGVIEESEGLYRVYVLVPGRCCCDESTDIVLPNRSEF